MIDPITQTEITFADLMLERDIITRQIEAAKTEAVEIIFRELKWRKELQIKELLNETRRA